jgi:hypothetical protein
MYRRLLLVVVALALFGGIVGGAWLYARARNGRSQPTLALAELEGVETAVFPLPTSPSNRLTTPRAVPFPAGSLDHSFFPLSGGHQPVDCAACHLTGDYQGTDPGCHACHAQDDPHNGQYGLLCADCHVIESWQLATFDHSLAAGQDCAACHAPPPNHFPGQCSACHTTSSWAGATFNHTFPINHEGADGNCATCHPGGETAVYTCTACHSPEKMDKEHDDVQGFGGTSCVQCHADGREPDDDDD